MKNNLQTLLKRFDEKFVNKTVKQVDTGNSIELPLWKNPHSHQTQDVKDFLVESIKDALEACRVGKIEQKVVDGNKGFTPMELVELAIEGAEDSGWGANTTQYDENVKRYLGKEEV